MKNNLKIVIGVLVGSLVLAGLIWIASPSSLTTREQVELRPGESGVINAEENTFDFDSISMANGDVSHKFEIKNLSENPVNIEKIYTSCMCTDAKLFLGDKSFGPYGMPGHGMIPKINQIVGPNEEAVLEVIFDPAAHGPAGVGRIIRVVYVENSGGQPLEFTIAATVTP